MKKKHIRPIVLCLFRDGDRLLVSETYDSVKGDYYCRPLGGGIEFGEHSRDAMLREIQEEIGAEVEGLELMGVLENIFICEGVQGHEIVFVYDARFKNSELYEREEIQCYEIGIEAEFIAKWRSLEEIRGSNVRLVPEGLAELLSKGDLGKESV